MKRILIFAGICLIAGVVLALKLRLPEYYSLKKNSLRVYGANGQDNIKAIYYCESRGGYDSTIIPLKEGEAEIIRDIYGKQWVVFDINNYRWDPDIGFLKMRGWYKFSVRLYITRLKDCMVLRATSRFNGSIIEVRDTVLLSSLPQHR